MSGAPHQQHHRQLVIVGGGPAGLSAALLARQHGIEVVLLDERAQLGGQYYKRMGAAHQLDESKLGAQYRDGSALIAAVLACGAEIMTGAVAWGIFGNRVAVETVDGRSFDLIAERIIVAPGAYDRPFVFPGWTLPGVITAGGAQSLVKYQRVAIGERVVMAGSGPLPLAFAVQLHQLGVTIAAVVEASHGATWRDMISLLAAAPGNWQLLGKGLFYLAYLRFHKVPIIYGHIVAAAEGKNKIEAAVLQPVDGGWLPVPKPTLRIAADTICIGYGLLPSTELIAQAGCAMRYAKSKAAHVPVRDAWMRSSLPHIFCPGDGGGIEGAPAACAAGKLAGLAVAADLGMITIAERDRLSRPVRKQLKRSMAFQKLLRKIYPTGRNSVCLADAQTIVCRCEEVTVQQLRDAGLGSGAPPQELKNRTRLSMGLCQGRNCATTLAALVSHVEGIALSEVLPFTPRPPVKPISIGAVARFVPETAHADLTH